MINNPELVVRNQRKLLMYVAKQNDTGCWVWQGQISNSGYGKVLLKSDEGNKMHSVHRAAFELFVGGMKKDDIVVQTCGNRLCINPEHLKAVDEIDDTNWKKSL